MLLGLKNPATREFDRIQAEEYGLHVHINVDTPYRTLHARQSRRVCSLDDSVWAGEDNIGCQGLHYTTCSLKLGFPDKKVGKEV